MEFYIMRHFRISCLIVLAFVLGACQSLTPNPQLSQNSSRLQGTLTHNGENWLFKTCDTDDIYTMETSAEFNDEFKNLLVEAPHGLFADLSGDIDTQHKRFNVSQRYRVQTEGYNCNDPDFARLLLRASGNEPFWSILQTPRGLIFNQIDQPTIALPYIEEQLPDGRFHISTQANKQNLQLWITPQRCTDSMSGSVYHLNTQLQWNQQTLQGCAAYGALRD
jgi:putative lipoprotein